MLLDRSSGFQWSNMIHPLWNDLEPFLPGVNQPNKIKDTKGHELASRVGTTLKSKNSIDFLLLKMLAASLMIFSFPPTSQLPNNSARIGPAKFGGAGPDRPGRNSEFQDVLRRLKLLSKLLPALGSYWLHVILVGNVGRSRKKDTSCYK